jgi:hypothetical protein
LHRDTCQAEGDLGSGGSPGHCWRHGGRFLRNQLKDRKAGQGAQQSFAFSFLRLGQSFKSRLDWVVQWAALHRGKGAATTSGHRQAGTQRSRVALATQPPGQEQRDEGARAPRWEAVSKCCGLTLPPLLPHLLIFLSSPSCSFTHPPLFPLLSPRFSVSLSP